MCLNDIDPEVSTVSIKLGFGMPPETAISGF